MISQKCLKIFCVFWRNIIISWRKIFVCFDVIFFFAGLLLVVCWLSLCFKPEKNYFYHDLLLVQKKSSLFAITRGGHLRRNNYGASLRRNYFTCDSACAAIIFKRLR